jgi:hypothetical protein
MDFLKLSVVPKKDAVLEIFKALTELYGDKVISSEIELTINDLFAELQDNLAVCIEYPYVDKVYRDTYYHYFASKHREYARDAIRISFFNKPIEPKHFRESSATYLQQAYMGYIVLRPTFPRIIGRSLLDKRVLKETNFSICRCSGNVLVNGVKLDVSGFPFSSQDSESITCAETSLWAIMEYFGNRYPEYRPALPSHVLAVLNKGSNQRMLPSNGLTAEQISFALKEFGFGTYVYSRDEFKSEFENIIATYIESGIPVVATLHNKKVTHAILIIGHEEAKITHTKKRNLKFGRRVIPYTDYNDVKKKYVIQDDNLTPYKLIHLNYPDEHYKGWNGDFGGCLIDSIVVPLYSKIYLEAVLAKRLLLNIVSDKEYGWSPPDNFVFRFFLASSRSFKNHIATSSGINEELQDILMLVKMPKFIWCGEFYTKTGINRNEASGIIVLDATEAGENEKDALIFASYPNRCIAKVGKSIVSLNFKLNLYKSFKSNLQ